MLLSSIILPIQTFADISFSGSNISTKGAIINATNSISAYSMNIKDGGIKIQATSSSEEKNYTFYRVGSSTQLTTSLILLSSSQVNFTINNTPPSDTTLNITGAQIQSLYLNNHGSTSWHYTGGINVITIGSARDVAIYYSNSLGPNKAIDNDLSTEWQSNNEINPQIRLQISNAADQTAAAIAIYYDGAKSTATQIEIDASSDNSTWKIVRTVNTNLLSNGAWNYIRWDFPNILDKYIRVYGTDGSAKTLAIWEIKVLSPTSQFITILHGHKLITPTNGSLALNS